MAVEVDFDLKLFMPNLKEEEAVQWVNFGNFVSNGGYVGQAVSSSLFHYIEEFSESTITAIISGDGAVWHFVETQSKKEKGGVKYFKLISHPDRGFYEKVEFFYRNEATIRFLSKWK